MPETSNRLFNNHLVSHIYPLLIASKGRAFILSTSIKSMNEITSLLKDEFEKIILVTQFLLKVQVLKQNYWSNLRVMAMLF